MNEERQAKQAKTSLSKAVTDKLEQYLQSKHFEFASLGSNAIILRRRVIVEQKSRTTIKHAVDAARRSSLLQPKRHMHIDKSQMHHKIIQQLESIQSHILRRKQQKELPSRSIDVNRKINKVNLKLDEKAMVQPTTEVRFPMIEVKSLVPLDQSPLAPHKITSLRKQTENSSSRVNLSSRQRNAVQSITDLKSNYEQEITELMEYRDKKRKSFSKKFYQKEESLNITAVEIPQYIQVIQTEYPPSETPLIEILNERKSLKVGIQGASRKEQKQQKEQKQVKIFREPNVVYDNKMKSYRQFIFLLSLAHGFLEPVEIKQEYNIFKSDNKYKAFVGRGNNSLLIKGLLKRRYWWTVEDDHKNCNFAWSQLKINSFFDTEVQGVHTEPNDSGRIETLTIPVLKTKRLEKEPKKNKPDTPEGVAKILVSKDIMRYNMAEKHRSTLNQDRQYDFKIVSKIIGKKLQKSVEDKKSIRLHNHLEFNYFMGNKKAMFYNMRQYYQLIGANVFDNLPLTFHIKKGLDDREYKHFLKEFRKKAEDIKIYEKHYQEQDDLEEESNTGNAPRNIWIVKPGELSNRGNGITVIEDVHELVSILKKKEIHPNGSLKTYIVQAYLDRPLLYNKRKFDLRHYMLVTTLYGKMRAYWYNEGYVRTSSYRFDLDDLGNQIIHLTNDAIQKYGEDYGRYEEGNKLSYGELQKYLDSQFPKKGVSFYEHIYVQMKKIATDAVKASYMRLDPRRLHHNFQVLGLDFMIDQNFKVWLIEINTNPCLEISCGLLGRIIPTMVEQSLRLTLDVLFPPPAEYPNTMKHLVPDKPLDNLKYQLIFDQENQGPELLQLYKGCTDLDFGQISEEDETFENQGKEEDLDLK